MMSPKDKEALDAGKARHKIFEEYCKRFCPLIETTRFNDEHTQYGHRFSKRDAKIFNFIVEHFELKKDF